MKTLLKKEWLLAIRRIHEIWQPLFFALIIVILFPLGVGTDKVLLQKIAPGVIWVAVLLSVLLASEKCFKNDFEDGSLEQLVLSGRSLMAMIGAKILIQWTVQILPLFFVLPLLGTFYDLPLDVGVQLALTLLLGSPSLLLLGMLGSAVTLSITRSGMLLILVILPLYIPTLIFALSAISAHVEGFSNIGQFSMLGALLLFSLTICPFAIKEAIKVSLAEC